MADQRKNAGNIGDIIKHAILSEVVSDFDSSMDSWTYVETHAGFYNYSLESLKNQRGDWSGERAWGIGMIKSDHYTVLGNYGKQLSKATSLGYYPGSICLVQSIAKKIVGVVGRDIFDEQIATYQSQPKIKVTKGDGYSITNDINTRERLVFCDPYWKGDNEFAKVRELVEREQKVIVWYPLSKDSFSYCDWQRKSGLPYIELEFSDYQPRPKGWAGQDMKGAGMTLKGIGADGMLKATQIAFSLKKIFSGRTANGRKLDLHLSLSC